MATDSIGCQTDIQTMNRISRLLLICTPMATLMASAVAPVGYYSTLNGKSGAELRAALKEICGKEFTKIEYGSAEGASWSAFARTDVRDFEGRQIWRDMYSNNVVYVESGHDALNIEHCLPKSWWTKLDANNKGDVKYTTAYSDLHHLNPSDASANNKKGSVPLGVCSSSAWTNGLVFFGAPVSGFGGGATSVFEPADEYKGDFARAYFYMLTYYGAINWNPAYEGKNALVFNEGGEVGLQPWFLEMLLKWSDEDPVDAVEENRNDIIAEIQKNRNPYIDCPELAHYVFGNKQESPYMVLELPRAVVNRPSAPTFAGYWQVGVNQYSGKWWNPFKLNVSGVDGDLYVKYGDGEWQRFGNCINIPEADAQTKELTIEAYCEKNVEGYVLRSPISRIKLMPKDPTMADYTAAVWEPVTASSEISTDDIYILLSELTEHVMCSTIGNNFVEDAGLVRKNGNNIVTLPNNFGIVTFEDAGAGKYFLKISDASLSTTRYMNCPDKSTLSLGLLGTPASVSIDANGCAVIDFGAAGKLQFNKTQPRFKNYTSTQGNIKMYRLKNLNPGEPSSVLSVEGDTSWGIVGNNLILPQGAKVFNLSGMETGATNLQSGIYLVVYRNGVVRKVKI